MKKLILVISALSLLSCGADAQKDEKQNKPNSYKTDKEFLAAQVDGIYAKFETTKGNIYTVLNYNKAPMTVANFVGLAEGKIKNTAKAEGAAYYNGLTFHRVEKGFVIQGGDPAGNGSGGPGYNFNDEPVTENYDKGILAMANAGPNTNGSQFFIMLENNAGLPKNYTIFGKVLSGQEVVDIIAVGDTMRRVVILRKGKEAQNYDAAKVFEFEKANVGVKAAAKAKADAEMVSKVLNEKYASAKSTPSGLRYVVVQEGTGKQPTSAKSTVTVHYTGMYLTGEKFDSSVDRGQPATFGLNGVIAGWTEGLQMMKEGGKMKLIIPPALAWGDRGFQGIPPNSWVMFDVELIKVEN